MTFLTPIPAIIAACVCVPALIAMYLLKLRRRELLVSSTRFWFANQRDTQGNVPWRLLQPSLTLLLQLLALSMLLLALGRPVLNKSRADRERTVVVVDSSASMAAQDMDQERSRFDVAVERAKAIAVIAAQTAEQGDVLIVDFAAVPRLIVPTSNGRRAIEDAIGSISQTDQPADIDTLVELLSGIVRTQIERTQSETDGAESDTADAAPKLLPTHIVLLTDGGNLGADRTMTTLEGETTSVRLPMAELAAMSNVRISYERIAPKPDTVVQHTWNAGITNISARRDANDAGLTRVLAQFQARTFVTDPVELPSVPVELWLDGTLLESRIVGIFDELVAQETFEVRAPRGGVLTVRLRTNDALEADNEASIVLQPGRLPSILFVVPDDELAEGNQLRGAAWLVGDVLTELPQRRLDMITETAWRRFEQGGAQPNVDMIVFDRVAPARIPTVPTISFGADIVSEGTTDPAQPVTILVWDRRHPLLRDVSLDSVSGVCVPMKAQIDGFRTTVLGQGVRGPVLLLHEREGVKHCVVGLELATSAWPMDVGFAIFLATAVESLTGTDPTNASVSFTTAENAFTLRRGDNMSDVQSAFSLVRWFGMRAQETVLKNITGADMAGPNQMAAHLGMLSRAGVYQIGESGATPTLVTGAWQPIAVNLLSATETLMRSPTELDIGERGALRGARAHVERELWPWCLIAALAMITLEWFASLNFRRVQRAG